jgi:pectate lyase
MFLRRIKTIGAALIIGAAIVAINPSPAHAANGEWALIKNVYNGLCMANAGGSTANNTRIVQYTCDPKAYTQWFEWDYIANPTTGWVRIYTNGLIGGYRCLTPAGGSTASLAQIVIYTCDANADQFYWKFLPVNNTYQIQNKKSGLCITPNGLSTALNSVMVQYTCDAHTSRKWYDLPKG